MRSALAQETLTLLASRSKWNLVPIGFLPDAWLWGLPDQSVDCADDTKRPDNLTVIHASAVERRLL